MGVDVPPPASAHATDVPAKEAAAVEGPESKLALVKNVEGKAPFETPVVAYEDAAKVPTEFVITDLKKIPNRCWGDDDDSKPAVDFPVIDMGPLLRELEDEEGAKKVIAELGTASENWGFFQVLNHGVPEDVLDRVIDVANEFFQLPLEEKQAYAVRPGETEGYGRLDFNLAGAGAARTRFWNDVMRHDIRPVRTIEEDRMPNKPETYRPLIEEYTQGMERVLEAVWRALSVYLGLAPETLKKAQEEEDESHLIIRLNYYPKCSEPEKVLGVGAHKDFGSLTVLLQDQVGGLQVQKPGTTGWLDVQPKKGALLINVANQVEILSNGRLHSVLHRALVNRNCSRLSVAAFATPGPKCIIAPLKEVLEKSQQPPRYTQLLYGEYATNFAADVKAGISPHARYEINRN